MRRLKAFILSEILMTILLQAGLILVLCMSFYLFLDFYTRTQQILTARNHAERVIQFMDDKIRNAGLGLWKCGDSAAVRAAMRPFTDTKKLLEDFRLPVALMVDHKNTTPQYCDDEKKVQHGSVLTLLYGARNLDENTITVVTQDDEPEEISASNHKYKNILLLLDGSKPGVLSKNNGYVKSLFEVDSITDQTTKNKKEQEVERYRMNRYAVTEGTGYPMYMHDLPEKGSAKGHITAYTYNKKVTVNNASELIPLKCMKMFIHDAEDGLGRQFTFSETEPDENNKNNAKWKGTYHQEVGILEIYMTFNIETNIFTLYVLAEGGDNPSGDTERPKTWPENAEPTAENWGKKISDTQDYSKYPYKVVYVARKSWKLNNIPEGFSWN